MTPEQRAILAHVVVDPDAWQANNIAVCIEKYGPEDGAKRAEQNLAAKVARWAPHYEREKDAPGYQTRAVRDRAERRAELARRVGLKGAELEAVLDRSEVRLKDVRAAKK